MPKVIITRAEPGHSQTLEHVRALGLTAMSAPMLDLVARDVPLPDFTEYGALLFTSANGVRFFAERVNIAGICDLGAYCVGPATLEAAKHAGFEDCQNADGDAEDLAALIAEHRTPSHGKLLHIANQAAAGHMAQTLRTRGFGVDFLPLYAAHAARTPLQSVRETLAASAPALVLVHSAKAAEAFKALYELPRETPHMLVAVSEKAARPLAGAGFASTIIAERPNETTLMAALLAACARL